MKLLLTISILLLSISSFAQDTTFRYNGWMTEVKRIGVSKIHKVEGKDRDKLWISGKVKRINYEYMFTRTFHGSTQPSNPKEFYKPIKKKSFYYVPIGDITIKYVPNGPVFQTLSMDSLILRSYRNDGTPLDIYFLNEDLQADSIYRFFENGKLRTMVLGSYNQLKENLVLSLNHQPVMTMRQVHMEWQPDNRSASMFWYLGSNYAGSKTLSYPIKQYYCHGNGIPQVEITWYPDSIGARTYHKKYAFFDPQGNSLDSNHISDRGVWSGVRYKYYKSGALKSIQNKDNDQFYGKDEHWNPDSTLNRIDYRSKSGRDSIVYYKQLKDTLFTWRPPMQFKWNKQDTLTEASHPHCKLGFDNDGSVRFSMMSGSLWEAYRKNRDERMQLEHFGAKDELGFPHGRWFGLNALGDTVYEINYQHGWLNGPYRECNSYSETNWTRTYKMGLEIDSSVKIYKGYIREIQYFSEPGKLAKKAVYGNEGRLWFVDTTLNGKKFYRLRGLHKDGWDNVVGRIDTALNQIYTKFYFARDTLANEKWTDYKGSQQERKDYYRETGTLKTHWKSEGWLTKTEENSEPGKAPKKSAVRLAFQWTYDEAGNLIKKERLENGVVVE